MRADNFKNKNFLATNQKVRVSQIVSLKILAHRNTNEHQTLWSFVVVKRFEERALKKYFIKFQMIDCSVASAECFELNAAQARNGDQY